MKPSENNLERLLKRVARGDTVSIDDVIFHWRGLAKAGDHLVIRILNRTGGWAPFVKLGPDSPAFLEALQTVSGHPGISKAGMEALRSAGFQESEIQKNAADIIHAVQEGVEEDWPRTIQQLKQNPDLMDGALILLEESDSTFALQFLKTLSNEALANDQDQQIRKVLYRIKQRVGESVMQVQASVSERELFAFAENRLPLSQLIFYFRPHSSFSPKGDLYLISIHEGHAFDSSQQARDIDLDSAALAKISNQYAERLKAEYGVETVFHPMPPDHARYFLNESRTLLQDKPADSRLVAFLKFIGPDPVSDPLSVLRQRTSETGHAEVTELFGDPYFSAWMVPADSLTELFSRLQNLKEGPIILPEAQRKVKEHAEITAAARDFFSTGNRNAWSQAFEKAAYFLQHDQPKLAATSLSISEEFAKPSIQSEDMKAASVLFERALHFHNEQQRVRDEENRRTSLIMSPEEFERSLQRKK